MVSDLNIDRGRTTASKDKSKTNRPPAFADGRLYPPSGIMGALRLRLNGCYV